MAKNVKKSPPLIAIFLMLLLCATVCTSLPSTYAAELNTQEKGLVTLSNVVGLNLSDYNTKPVAYSNNLYKDLLPRENVRYYLTPAQL